MKILVTGACGFVGSTIAAWLVEAIPGAEVSGLDNLWRPGSESNRARLRALGVKVVHSDLRSASDLENLPRVDWVVDAAANASVLAGVDGATSPRQLIEHNLIGTVNVLEYCRRVGAGLILLSSSRVYSISGLKSIPLDVSGNAFVLQQNHSVPGLTPSGISESFSTASPISLYGATKLASENLAIEYAASFDMPVWINRCGVLAGAGQFGQPAQGIFAWWINRWQKGRGLGYLGFGGKGHQVRDSFHPLDLCALIAKQIGEAPASSDERMCNVAGGISNAMSLAQLSAWCENRFGKMKVGSDSNERALDVPWVVLDSSRAKSRWGWTPSRALPAILEEIATHAEAHPEWLEVSEG